MKSSRTGIVLAALGALSACAGRAPASAPSTGTLTVGVSTTGPDVTSLSFGLAVGPHQERIAADSGIVTLSDLPTGAYMVSMSLPPRCRTDGSSSRQVRVSAGRTTAVRFSVRCDPSQAPASPP